MLNHHSLMHPRTLWEIEAAMRSCLEVSRVTGYCARAARSAKGKGIVLVEHFRYPDVYGRTGFRFIDPNNRICTDIVLKALRASTKGE